MRSFKCKICAENKPLGDSVSLESKICCTCFTSIQIHRRVMDKITFFKKILQERAEMTPVRKNKIRLIEKMNNIFAFSRGDILQLSMGDIAYFIEGYLQEKYRKNGRKAICLPFLKWIHNYHKEYSRFPDGRVANYVREFKELDMDLAPIYEHFGKDEVDTIRKQQGI